MKNTIPDDELCILLAQGNTAAYKAIYDKYWHRIYKVALLYLKETSLAEDIVQNVFLKLWELRANAAAIQNIEAYLRVMARNEVISGLRKASLHLTALDDADEHIPGELQEPYNMMVYRESSQIILQAMEQLPPQQRHILHLSRDKGLTHSQIAEQTGVLKGTVKKHITRALAHIRRYLLQQQA